jgi:hypothetical protein
MPLSSSCSAGSDHSRSLTSAKPLPSSPALPLQQGLTHSPTHLDALVVVVLRRVGPQQVVDHRVRGRLVQRPHLRGRLGQQLEIQAQPDHSDNNISTLIRCKLIVSFHLSGLNWSAPCSWCAAFPTLRSVLVCACVQVDRWVLSPVTMVHV